MTNYRDRFQNKTPKKLNTATEASRVLPKVNEAELKSEAESQRYISAYFKQQSRYIPEIDYKNPSTFAFFGSAEKYYEDSIKSIYNTYPYDGSRAEKAEWSLDASYLDLYLLEHEYPKETGHIIFSRDGDTITADPNGYPTTDNPQYIKFFGGPQKNTVYNASKNREGNIKIDGTPGNTIEFWLKKESNSWSATAGDKEVIFDVCSSNDSDPLKTARMTVELDQTNLSPFLFTYMSGATGANQLRLGTSTVTTSSVADGSWHHYAFTAITSGSSTVYKFYIDGTLNDTQTVAHVVGENTSQMIGAIGALRKENQNTHGDLGQGKLDASIDEVRFWKEHRDEKEIGRFWYNPVHGGTDGDHTNAALGLYYKFNEGITGEEEFDKVVLDYSGRINNGEIVGWEASMRSLDSGITLATVVPEEDFAELGDPILNPSNSKIVSLVDRFEKIGKSHDANNKASLSNSVPQYFIDEGDETFLNLLQIMSSAFDDLFLKIKFLPKMKEHSSREFFKEQGSYRQSQNNGFLIGCEEVTLKEFTGHHAKPWISNTLEHFGIVSSDIFQDASLFERFINRTEEANFEHNLEEVKKFILANIHSNLVHILKKKGTEEGFRNLIRCFGIDDELVKLNTYGDNEVYELVSKPVYTAIKHKSINFEGQNFQGTIHQTSSASDSTTKGYIEATTALTPFTMEGNFIFPKYDPKTSVALNTVSLFGMHTVEGSANPSDPLTVSTPDSAGLQVRVKRSDHASPAAHFELTSSGGLITALTSSNFPDVYENGHWNISVRIGAKEAIDFNVVTPSEYLIEFTGYNYDLDVEKNSFYLTASITPAQYQAISQTDKAMFVGAHKTNFTGSVLTSTDVHVLGFNAWKDVLSEDELREHAQNPKVFGRKRPQSISNFDTGTNTLALDSLLFRWQFEAHEESSVGGTISIEDLSSGFGDDVTGFKYLGHASGLVNQSTAIEQEFLAAVQYSGIDNTYSSDRVKIKTLELEKFKADSRPTTHNFTFEKSMYQIISKEMVNFFAGIIGLGTIIGEPVNKYRKKYKLLEKVRNRFFARVGNVPDIDKFIEYYKWIDSSLSMFLEQLVPASSFLSARIRDVVESHVLERNKYEHKTPTIEFKDPSENPSSVFGIGELLYNWKFGHGIPNYEIPINQKAIQFIANGDTVDVPDDDTMSFTDGNGTDRPFSISAWVKPGNITTDSGVIISRRNSAGIGIEDGEWMVQHVNGGIEVILYADPLQNGIGSFSTLNRIIFRDQGTKLTSNTWNHVVVTYVGNQDVNDIKVYLNGSEIIPTHVNGARVKNDYSGMPNFNITTTIGGTDNPTTNTFEDQIADVAIFDKDLTSLEITELYAGGKVIDISNHSAWDNVVSWWRMGDYQDTSDPAGILDYKGTNHGTLVGTATIEDVLLTDLPSDTDFRQSSNENCLWVKERAEVSPEREVIKRITHTEVSGSTYATRRLVKPYRLEADNVVTTSTGFNRDAAKLVNPFTIINSGKNVTLDGATITDQDKCPDVLDPTTKEVYRGLTDVTGTNGYLDGDSDLVLPFNLMSSSAGTDLPGLKDNLKVSNNHLTLDITGEKPLQGPFGETHIAGMPHRKVRFGTADADRAEAYTLTVTNGILTMSAPPTDTPKSMFFRDVPGTRLANISNIGHDTGSLVLGNYSNDYQVVMVNGRSLNNNYFIDNSGDWVNQFTQSADIDGVVNYEVPDRGKTEHVIVNRFSSPGGPETAAAFGMDIESEEYSIYNTINYRNATVRDVLNLLHSERSDQFGFRAGSSTQASVHMTNRNTIRTTGSGGDQVDHDNFFVQRPLPSNDFGYSWIKASADQSGQGEDVYSFLLKNDNFGYQHKFSNQSGVKSSQTINFVTSSQLTPNSNLSFGNWDANASYNTSSNTLEYASSVELNTQITNKQGAYGWPTWKQIRGNEHPGSRWERTNAKMTLVIGKNAVTGAEYLFPKTRQSYEWSTNKNLYKVDLGGTAVIEKILETYDEVMTTNRFNPLTITLHGGQAGDLSTSPISQKGMEIYWNRDETSLTSLQSDAARVAQNPFDIGTRLASIKVSAGNQVTTFANPSLSNRLKIDDIMMLENVSDIIEALAEVSLEDEDVFATEINYIETLYPREVNTFTKESRIRELFDFFSWRDNRSDREIILEGSIVNHVGSQDSDKVGLLANKDGASFLFNGTTSFVEVADNDALTPATASISSVAVRNFTNADSRLIVSDHDDFSFIEPVTTAIAVSKFDSSPANGDYYNVTQSSDFVFSEEVTGTVNVKSFSSSVLTRISAGDQIQLTFTSQSSPRPVTASAFNGTSSKVVLSQNNGFSYIQPDSSTNTGISTYNTNSFSTVSDNDQYSLVARSGSQTNQGYARFLGWQSATDDNALTASNPASGGTKDFSMIDQSTTNECSYSVMFYIKTAETAVNRAGIVGKGNNSNDGREWHVDQRNRKITLTTRDPVNQKTIEYAPASDILDNSSNITQPWQHIALTYDVSNAGTASQRLTITNLNNLNGLTPDNTTDVFRIRKDLKSNDFFKVTFISTLNEASSTWNSTTQTLTVGTSGTSSTSTVAARIQSRISHFASQIGHRFTISRTNNQLTFRMDDRGPIRGIGASFTDSSGNIVYSNTLNDGGFNSNNGYTIDSISDGAFAVVKIYKNGALAETITEPSIAADSYEYGSMTATTGPLIVGDTPWSGTTSTDFKGWLSNLVLYKHDGRQPQTLKRNTSVLSSFDVARLYNDGLVFDYQSNNRYRDMVAWYKFSNTNETTAGGFSTVPNEMSSVITTTALTPRQGSSSTTPEPVASNTASTIKEQEKAFRSFVLSFWIYPHEHTNSSKRMILSKGDEWLVYKESSSIKFRLYDSSLFNSGKTNFNFVDFGSSNSMITSSATNNTTATHVVIHGYMSVAGRIDIDFYKNGALSQTSHYTVSSGNSNVAVAGDGLQNLRSLNTGDSIKIGHPDRTIADTSGTGRTALTGFDGGLAYLAFFVDDDNTIEWTAQSIGELHSINSTIGAGKYDYRRHPMAAQLTSFWKLDAPGTVTDVMGLSDAAPASSPDTPGTTTSDFLIPVKDYEDVSFSLSAWVKFNDDAGAIISKADQTSSNHLTSKLEWTLETTAGGNLQLVLFDDRPIIPTNTTSKAFVEKIFFNTNTLSTGWNHIAVVYKAATDEVDFYINAVKNTNNSPSETAVGTSSSYTSMTLTSTEVIFGAEKSGSGGNTNRLDGSLYNVVVYNAGKELSQTEVNELFNAGNAWEIRQASTWSDMLSYYKMNNTSLVDVKGNTTATATSIVAATDSGLNIVQDEDRSFTIAFWFKKDTTSSTKDILAKWGNTNADQEYRLQQNNRGFKLTLKDTTGTDNQVTTNIYTSSQTILNTATNQWQHVVITYDGITRLVNFYVDSVRDSSGDTASGASGHLGSNDENFFEMQDGGAAFVLGALSSGNTPGVSADISNLLVFKHAERQAPLTDSQVVELYNEGFVYDYEKHSRESDLVLWWKLDDASGFSVQDSSGQNLNGTANVSMGQVASSLKQRSYQDKPFTVSFWMNSAATADSTTWTSILSKKGNDVTNTLLGEWRVGLATNNRIFFSVLDTLAQGATTAQKTYLTANNVISQNEWKFVTITYNPLGASDAERVKFYIGDHQPSSPTSLSPLSANTIGGINNTLYSSMRPSTFVLRIGNGPEDDSASGGDGSSNENYTGMLSNVAIYNATLSSTEVNGLYNSGFPHGYRELTSYANAVSYWKLNHTTTSNAIDSKSGNTGVNVGVVQEASTSSGLSMRENEDIPFSFAFWINKESTANTSQVFAKMSNANTLREYSLQLAGHMNLQLNDTTGLNAGATALTAYSVASSFTSGDVNTWIHYAGTWDPSTRTFTVYKNGVLHASQNTGTNPNYSETQNTTAHFTIGGLSGTSLVTGSADASLSNLILFRDHVLSLSEVEELYNDGYTYDYSQHSQYDNALAWWKLDETTAGTTVNFSDSKNSHDASLAPATSTAVPLVPASSSTLEFREFLTTPITVTAWIKPDTLTGNGAIISKFTGTAPNKEFTFVLQNRKLRFFIAENATDGDNTTHNFTSGDLISSAEQWYHVAVAYTPNTSQSDGGDVVFYVDGVAHADNTANPSSGFVHPVTNTTANLNIGAYNNGNNQLFAGNIARVLLYITDPTAGPLTGEQISTIYNLGFCYETTDIPRLSEATGYWKLDDSDDPDSSTTVTDHATGSTDQVELNGTSSNCTLDESSSPEKLAYFYKIEEQDRFDYRRTNGFGTDFVNVDSGQTGANPNHITASRWPLDARKDFTARPLDLSTSSFNSTGTDQCFTYVANNHATRGEGILQNDYSIFGCGANFQFALPPAAPVYSRRVPQTVGSNEYLAGEAEWKVGEQLGVNPFDTDFEKHATNFRQLGQDHSLVPEFIVSNHVEDIVLNNRGEYTQISDREEFLTVTGAVYHKSSGDLQVAEKFYKTYGISDMMKYFGVTMEEVENNDLGSPTKITLRCKAAIKFTPYRGFYPAERVQQITEMFSRGYLPEFEFETVDTTPVFVQDQETLLKTKIRANLQQSIKPLFAPGVLMNSIKSGMAVDYPLFGNVTTPSFQTVSSSSGVNNYQNIEITPVSDGFSSLSIHGSYMAIGRDEFNGVNTDEGVVSIYKLQDVGNASLEWVFLTNITPPASVSRSSFRFGVQVYMSSEHLAITARDSGTDSGGFTIGGQVFIYSRTGDTFSYSDPTVSGQPNRESRLNFKDSTEPDPTNPSSTVGRLGPFLVEPQDGGLHYIDKNILVLSRINYGVWIWRSNTATAESNGSTWDFEDPAVDSGRQDQLIRPDSLGSDAPIGSGSLGTSFGEKVVVSGNTMVIAAPVSRRIFTGGVDNRGIYNLGGAAFVYKLSEESGQFEYKSTLKLPTAIPGAAFGYSMDITDDQSMILIGAPGDTDRFSESSTQGSVLIYTLGQDGAYSLLQEIPWDQSFSATPGFISKNNFGRHVAFHNSTTIIVNGNTSAYLFYKGSTDQFEFVGRVPKARDGNTAIGYTFLSCESGKIVTAAYGSIQTGPSSVQEYIDVVSVNISQNPAVDNIDVFKRLVSSPASSFNTEYTKFITTMTGSIVNGSVDSGAPRLKGDTYKRVTFEEMMNPDSLKGLTIEDQEPHPSASTYHADKYTGKVMDFPFRFGELDATNNEIDLGVSSFTPKQSLSTTMKPYRLAINNFCAETINFFLKEGKTATLETKKAASPELKKDQTYKMRIEVLNNGVRMYDRHSAFGPAVDEGTIKLLEDGTEVSVTASHAHSPFVPPFLDPNASPYVDISFTATEDKKYTLEEILQGAVYDYSNFKVAPSNPDENTNYKHAMSLSASLKLDGLVVYLPEENIDAGTTIEGRSRWVIQPRWETPVLDFSSATGSALNLDTDQTVTVEATKDNTPWQRRNWDNFYTNKPKASGLDYLTSSIGMWHQAGELPKSENGGYTIRIQPHPDVSNPDLQLATKVGFIEEKEAITAEVGKIRDRKVVYEAVVAIPFIEPADRNSSIKYFDLPQNIMSAAATANESKKNDLRNGLVTSEEYERWFNTPGQAKKDAIGYQLRMFDKYVIPEDFKGKMMYVFQFSAEFTRDDLYRIWQNVSPTSDFSGKDLRYSTVDNEQGISGISQDIQYVSNFLGDLGPTVNPMSFEKDKIRWVVLKVKQRAAFDLNEVKKESLVGYSEGSRIDTTKGTFNPTQELRNQKYSFNWPYDFFSIVELVKLEGKVDIFKGISPIEPPPSSEE